MRATRCSSSDRRAREVDVARIWTVASAAESAGQAAGPGYEHQRHGSEQQERRLLGQQGDAHGLDLPDDERTDECTLHRAEPTDHDDDQRHDEHGGVESRPSAIDLAAQHPRDRGEHGPAREDTEQHGAGVDPETLDHGAVRDRCPHQRSEIGALHQEVDDRRRHCAEPDQHEPVSRIGRAQDLRASGEHRGHGH